MTLRLFKGITEKLVDDGHFGRKNVRPRYTFTSCTRFFETPES